MSNGLLLSGAASIVGGILVAIATGLLTRRKQNAETDLLKAQAARETAEAQRILVTMGVKNVSLGGSMDPPYGWWRTGVDPQSYEVGVQWGQAYSGNACAYIEAIRPPAGFGALMQSFAVGNFAGKRLRMCAIIKTEAVRHAVPWLRMDGAREEYLSLDNMAESPIKGTTNWRKYCLVADVPDGAVAISFGIVQDGEGRTLLNSVEFDVVDDAVELTGSAIGGTPLQPVNLDFSYLPEH